MPRARGFAGLADTYDPALLAVTGMYVQPGIRSAYPDLANELRQLYQDRVAKLPFLPSDWFARVDHATITDPTQGVLLPMPTHDVQGFQTGGIPAWLTDPKNAAAWDAFRADVMEAYQSYAAGQTEAGRAVLAAAYANSDFWNGLYTLDSIIASPVTGAAAAVKDAAKEIGTGPLVAIGGILLLLFLLKN